MSVNFWILICCAWMLALVNGEPQYSPYRYKNYYKYYKYPHSGYSPDLAIENRFFWQLTSLLPTTTTTVYTSTTTCTKYTSSACSGRRKRFLIGDMEEEESIQPSPTTKVEITTMADVDSLERKERNAETVSALFYYPDHLLPYYIQPGFEPYQQFFPVYHSPYTRHQSAYVGDPRFFFVTITTTTSTRSTSTSTPSCSTSSSYNEC